MIKHKTPNFGNYKSFTAISDPGPIEEMEFLFHNDIEEKNIKWMIFGSKTMPTSDRIGCEALFLELYWNAKESDGNTYVREYSPEFQAVRYYRCKHLNTMEIPKPIKPKKHIKQMIADLKAIKENQIFKLKVLGTDQSTINAVRVAYKGCIDELEESIKKPRTESLNYGVKPVLA